MTGYVIERRLTSEKRWEKVDSVDASVTLYCVENLREKSEYEFRVFAENPVGRSLEPAMTEQVRLKTHASKFHGVLFGSNYFLSYTYTKQKGFGKLFIQILAKHS